MSKNDSKPLYRHELKYSITYKEREALLHRFGPLLKRDANGSEDGYTIRSLYFDDMWNTAYTEKVAGTFLRKKYRIRIYNYSDKVIKLECKEKQGNYIHKTAASLSRTEVERILKGDYGFLLKRDEILCKEFYLECTTKMMRPSVIVDYERDAFVEAVGDVRITFDKHVRAAWMNFDIFDEKLPAYEVLESDRLIMEVKYTEALPEVVRRVISPYNSIQVAASKFTMCEDKKYELTGR